jgi:hypothetical protein
VPTTMAKKFKNVENKKNKGKKSGASYVHVT